MTSDPQPATPATPHPLGLLAARHLTADGGAPAYARKGLELIELELMKLASTPELERGMRALVDLAAHLHRDRGATDASMQLLTVAAKAAPLLERRKSAEARVALSSAEAARETIFSGMSAAGAVEGSSESQAFIRPRYRG